MSRIAIPGMSDTPPESQPALNSVSKILGFVPNLHRLMSLSPRVLFGWAALMEALSKTLDVKTRNGIALAVSEADGCDYCVASHTFVSKLAHTTIEETLLNREGKSQDPKRQAAFAFAKALIEARGKVSDAEFEMVRSAGWSDANILEIIALTGQSLLANFINNAIETPVDFPEVLASKW